MSNTWRTPTDRLNAFVTAPLVWFATLVGQALAEDDSDEDGGAGLVWLVVITAGFGFWALCVLFVKWMVTGGPA